MFGLIWQDFINQGTRHQGVAIGLEAKVPDTNQDDHRSDENETGEAGLWRSKSRERVRVKRLHCRVLLRRFPCVIGGFFLHTRFQERA